MLNKLISFGGFKQDSYYIQKYLDTLDLKPNNTKKLFVLGFICLPGTGKSYISNILEKKLDLGLSGGDDIRAFLDKEGFRDTSRMKELINKISYARNAYFFDNKTSLVVDGDLTQVHQTISRNAKIHGADIMFINIECPENIVIARLEKRDKIAYKNTDIFIQAGVDEYYARKAIHAEAIKPDTYFTFDATKDIEAQVLELKQKLISDGYL